MGTPVALVSVNAARVRGGPAAADGGVAIFNSFDLPRRDPAGLRCVDSARALTMTQSTMFLRSTLVAVATLVGASVAGAQTTVILNQPGTQVTDTMIQAGHSAQTHFNGTGVLATRAS